MWEVVEEIARDRPRAPVERPRRRRGGVRGPQRVELELKRREELVQDALSAERDLVRDRVGAHLGEIGGAVLLDVHRAREVRVVRLLDGDGEGSELEELEDPLHGAFGVWRGATQQERRNQSDATGTTQQERQQESVKQINQAGVAPPESFVGAINASSHTLPIRQTPIWWMVMCVVVLVLGGLALWRLCVV